MPQAIGAAIFAALGASSLGATVIAGTTLASIVGGVILTVAAGVLQYLLAPKPPMPKGNQGYYPLRQAIPPRITGYGEGRLAGFYMFYETLKDDSYDVLALHHGKIKEITRYYLHDDVVTLNENGTIATSSQNNRYLPEEEKFVIDTRLGLDTETPYSRVVDACAVVASSTGKAPMWTNDHRGDGIASLSLYCRTSNAKHFPKFFPRGVPVPSVAARMSYVYDPRDDGQDRLDRETYDWTDNCVIALADYLTSDDHGMGLDWEESFGDSANLIEEANICDEQIPLKAGGSEKRYTLGGVFQHDNSPSDVIATMLATCDGWIAEQGDGTIRVLVGKYRSPRVTFTDDHIRAYTVVNGVGDEDVINEFVPVYNSRDHEFADVEGQTWRDEEDISERGKVRSEKLDLKWVHSHSQARRLCKREMLRQLSRLRGTLVTTLYGLVGLGERWIKLEIEDHPDLSDLVVEIVSSPRVDFLQGTVTFEWRSVNTNAVDSWDPDTEEGTAPPVTVRSEEEVPQAPTNINVVVEGSDDSAIYADVTFDCDARESTTYDVDIRIVGSGSGGWTSLRYDSDSVTITDELHVALTIPNLARNTNYELRLRITTGGGDDSGYSTIEEFDTFTIAPASPTSLSYDDVTGLIEWRDSASTSSTISRVFRADAGDPFTDAVDLTAPSGITSAPLAMSSFDPPDYVDGDYWVTAETATGLRSSPTGPLTIPTTVV